MPGQVGIHHAHCQRPGPHHLLGPLLLQILIMLLKWQVPQSGMRGDKRKGGEIRGGEMREQLRRIKQRGEKRGAAVYIERRVEMR